MFESVTFESIILELPVTFELVTFDGSINAPSTYVSVKVTWIISELSTVVLINVESFIVELKTVLSFMIMLSSIVERFMKDSFMVVRLVSSL